MKKIALLTVLLATMLITVGDLQGLTQDAPSHSVSSECPFDHVGGRGTWTGKTKVVNAKVFYEQKCIQGHRWYTRKP